jgi:hypothetical protein
MLMLMAPSIGVVRSGGRVTVAYEGIHRATVETFGALYSNERWCGGEQQHVYRVSLRPQSNNDWKKGRRRGRKEKNDF